MDKKKRHKNFSNNIVKSNFIVKRKKMDIFNQGDCLRKSSNGLTFEQWEKLAMKFHYFNQGDLSFFSITLGWERIAKISTLAYYSRHKNETSKRIKSMLVFASAGLLKISMLHHKMKGETTLSEYSPYF